MTTPEERAATAETRLAEALAECARLRARHANAMLDAADTSGMMGRAIHREESADARLAEALARVVELGAYLPILERLEASGEWGRYASGTGIATPNRFRAALRGPGG